VLRVSSPEGDRTTIARQVVTSIEDQLPPPGYLDVLFDD
jgi:hypothetical protein